MPSLPAGSFKPPTVQMTASSSFPEADGEVEDRELKVPVGGLTRNQVGRREKDLESES